ncbi:hypothetical protein NDU88_013022 [Pleurodeles waltl]|uniref:Uncharacterized protein n=1 Tax=Pleurodeles waltl TaxID=8319 RepID=A0AAV7R4X4_PLEWA|nr:hypothetical protein NDU88_013022 [Pleurodeles waltl]
MIVSLSKATKQREISSNGGDYRRIHWSLRGCWAARCCCLGCLLDDEKVRKIDLHCSKARPSSWGLSVRPVLCLKIQDLGLEVPISISRKERTSFDRNRNPSLDIHYPSLLNEAGRSSAGPS